MNTSKLAILCAACKAETFIRREPVYEGFKKTGERLFCVSCGHAYADEAQVPYKAMDKPQVFTEADRSQRVELFLGDEKGRNCRHCRHYVVNPFVQRCSLHRIEVQATDLCADFSAAADVAAEKDDPLAKLLKRGD
jgi:hypothetical protein